MEKIFDFEQVGKRMPYTVPDGFFDKMEENVMEEVAKEKVQPINHKKAIIIALRAALPAAVAAILLFVVLPLLTKDSTGDFASVELAFNNLSTDDQDFLIDVYEDENYINVLTNTEDYE